MTNTKAFILPNRENLLEIRKNVILLIPQENNMWKIVLNYEYVQFGTYLLRRFPKKFIS